MNKPNKKFPTLSFLLLAICFISGLGVYQLIQYIPTYLPNLPSFYIFALGLLFILVIEALLKMNKPWSLPSLIIYNTTAIWYFTEPLYTPENLKDFSNIITENAYLQTIIFLSFFRFLVPQFSSQLVSSNLIITKASIKPLLTSNNILFYLLILWAGLLVFGISRMNGDIIAALFPISSRTGVQMWSRGAAASAGSDGFIVSSASNTYLLVCSFFGILLPLKTKYITKITILVLILISWPQFILIGARNQFLAVASPAYFSYVLLSKQKLWLKILITVVLLIALNYIFKIILTYRNVGFGAYFNELNQGLVSRPEQKHLGLNMLEELCFINNFYQQKTLQLSYGVDYIGEFLNFIPRAIWPEKPLLGIDYAILRGFGGGKNDIGVFATISTGFIGQGVKNFGPVFGPLAPALLLSLWASFLARLWSQKYSILRVCLFLAGLGITFNLGRDITLLVLWPFVFGYVLVRFIEYLNKRKLQNKSINYY